MIGQWLIWYITISCIGIIGIPISFRLFHKLYDRGLIFSRILVLFLWGYLFWILTSLHIIKNNLSGVGFSGFVIALISLFFIRNGQIIQIKEYIKLHWKTYLTAEAIFLIFFITWVFVRSTVPDISGTEKPMELAFINGILQSEFFPPQDPWLSGYGISYYYFGYVILSLLIQITGTVSGVAYNLSAALWFGLTALAAYGLLVNLLAFYQKRVGRVLSINRWAILAPVYVLIVSNIEGFLEMLHAGGLFWKQQADGQWVSSFWKWLNILELNQPPAEPFQFIPNRPTGILWWRASRVISDTNLLSMPEEVIDEFPFFSYLLGDLHPHVLAMPFVILTLALLFHFFIQLKDENSFFVYQWVKKWDMVFAVLLLGGLSFLNTWNFPIYVGLFSAVFAYHYYRVVGWKKEVIYQFIINGMTLGITGVILYLPFYLSFSSQAGGILPSLSYFTRGVIFWVMFMPLLLPIYIWLVRDNLPVIKKNWRDGIKFSLILLGGLSLTALLLSFLLLVIPSLIPVSLIVNGEPGLWEKLNQASGLLISKHGETNSLNLIFQSLSRRILSPGTLITLFGLVFLVWVMLKRPTDEITSDKLILNEGVFVGLMVLMGAGLTIFPEFMYLRDQFGTRMNTIFKFYFEAWILWGLAASYATVFIFENKTKLSWLFKTTVVVTLVLSFIYPFFMTLNRTNNFRNPNNWTLDGNRFRELYQPYDYAGAEWLRTADKGVIAEAVGGSYSGYARMATVSGQQNVLGWVGHEYQWRGGGVEVGSRETDLRRLYESTQWEEALAIIKMYQIRYIVIGSYESSTYNVRDQKFSQNLPVVFQNEGLIIFDAGYLLDQ
ncbi:MAG: hypothetical protein CL609_12385 [Anaerolineaceae bacterium]|nr:hypothetical protein [Anaerolineaceae bacterium]